MHRIARADGGQRAVAHVLPHDDAVHGRIELLGEVPDEQRDGELRNARHGASARHVAHVKQPPNAEFGHVLLPTPYVFFLCTPSILQEGQGECNLFFGWPFRLQDMPDFGILIASQTQKEAVP